MILTNLLSTIPLFYVEYTYMDFFYLYLYLLLSISFATEANKVEVPAVVQGTMVLNHSVLEMMSVLQRAAGAVAFVVQMMDMVIQVELETQLKKVF